jgi:hypothetical protein
MDPKFYENDYLAADSKDLEAVRSPFYDFARMERMNDKEADKLLYDI